MAAQGDLEAVILEDALGPSSESDRLRRDLNDRPQPDRLSGNPWWEEPIALTARDSTSTFLGGCMMFVPRMNRWLVVGHEVAHHDLGHVALFHGWTDRIIRLPGAALFALFFQGLERLLYNPQKECEADRHGLDLCVSAGYDGGRCLELFDILEQRAYDGDHGHGVPVPMWVR
jgi:hypothetical protein